MDLDNHAIGVVFAHREWLSASALMGNEYCVPLDPPFSDANADGYGQRFTIGTEHVGLVKRRREGRVHSLALEAKPMREARAWIDRYRKFWEGNLDQFEKYLDKLQKEENTHDHNR